MLPLAIAVYANRRFLERGAPEPRELPSVGWIFREQQALLDRSEQRLQSLETKGPGLATACAVVAAAIGVAVSLTWSQGNALSHILLVAAGLYVLMSLVAPITLVGPIARSTVTSDQLAEIVGEDDAEAMLARQCAQAAAENDRATQRLSNLQVASRNDLSTATVLFALWAIAALLGLAT